MTFSSRFAQLGYPNRIWAISAIHGQVENLQEIHKTVWDRFQPGDKMIYLGNYFGGAADSRPVETVEELLCFRRNLLARPGMTPEDFTYLRGIQEELWQKLLQLQFAPTPVKILEWMVEQGIDVPLRAYGSCAQDGLRAAREGIMNLTKWTNMLRQNIRAYPGHEKFGTVLKRAAFTECSEGMHHLLFVHAGVDESRPLATQGDSFWWGGPQFDRIENAYEPFSYVIRGYDPGHNGVKINGVTMSLDGGCGYGGALVCAEMTGKGEVLDLLQA